MKDNVKMFLGIAGVAAGLVILLAIPHDEAIDNNLPQLFFGVACFAAGLTYLWNRRSHSPGVVLINLTPTVEENRKSPMIAPPLQNWPPPSYFDHKNLVEKKQRSGV